MKGSHFLATDAWNDDEILSLVDDALRIKRDDPRGGLEGRVLGSVFFNPSLRTRASFEVAMLRHGGHMLTLEPGKGVWAFETRPNVVMDGDGGAVEHIREAAPVLGRYVDALGVRAFPSADTWEEARRDDVVHSFAEHAGVPVINLESARRHPCQGLADALTLRERFGETLRGRRFVLAWAYHPRSLPTAVPVSAAINAARVGIDVTIAHPPGFELDRDDMAAVRAVAEGAGAQVDVTQDLARAVDGADVVYAKSWGSLAHWNDAEAEGALRSAHRGWCISESVMATTRDGAGGFMHCLPVRRNVVVTDGVLDGPHSWVVDQAENRLHAQRALLLRILGGR
jgi:N-acetylornithine carbamoyltransferase